MVSGIVMDGLIGFRIRFIDENLFMDSSNRFPVRFVPESSID
jgi:hypothetical protein